MPMASEERIRERLRAREEAFRQFVDLAQGQERQGRWADAAVSRRYAAECRTAWRELAWVLDPDAADRIGREGS